MIKSKRSYIVLAILALAYFGSFLQRMSVNIISRELARIFSLDDVQLGFLGSAFLITYGTGIFASGALADKFGARKVLFLLYSLAGFGAIVFSLASDFTGALAGRVLCGLGTSVVLPASLVLMSRWFSAKDYPKACSLFFASGGLGHLLATTPLAAFIESFGWEFSFFAIGVFCLAICVVIYFCVSDYPSGVVEKEKNKESVNFIESIKFLIKNRNFWLLSIGNITLPGVYYAFTALWSGAYLSDVYGLSPVARGNILTMGAMGFLLGTPIVTWLAENILKSNRLAMLYCLPFGFLTAVMLVFFTDSMSTPFLYMLVLFIGLAANAPNAVRFNMARQLLGIKVVGIVGGIFGSSVFIMGAILQIVIGAILKYCQQLNLSTSNSYSYAFSIFLVLFLINAVATYKLPETFGKPTIDELNKS